MVGEAFGAQSGQLDNDTAFAWHALLRTMARDRNWPLAGAW
jgi:hypothetical protein